MALTATFWRRLSHLFGMAILVLLLQLLLLTAYPKEWDAVQVGMTISQVRSICGAPTYNNAGMKPDEWRASFLAGSWQLRVGHSEITQGPHSVVYSKEIRYAFLENRDAWLILQRCKPPVLDWEAFDQAFGQGQKPIDSAHPALSRKNGLP